MKQLPETIGTRPLKKLKSAQVCVLGLVDHSHASAAKCFQDVVVRDGLADHLGDE